MRRIAEFRRFPPAREPAFPAEPAGKKPSDGKKLSIPPGLVAAVLLVVALIFFVVQNGDDVAFEWLVFDMTGPLWVVILVAAVAGAVVNEVFGFVRRRRRRRRRR